MHDLWNLDISRSSNENHTVLFTTHNIDRKDLNATEKNEITESLTSMAFLTWATTYAYTNFRAIKSYMKTYIN